MEQIVGKSLPFSPLRIGVAILIALRKGRKPPFSGLRVDYFPLAK